MSKVCERMKLQLHPRLGVTLTGKMTRLVSLSEKCFCAISV